MSEASEIRFSLIPKLEKDLKDAEKLLEKKQKEGAILKEEVTSEEVAEVVSIWTGIPVTKMMQGDLEKLANLEDRLHERVIGQDRAVNSVASAIRRSRSGLSDPERPIGSFLFLGPTGVGKTELAKALAENLFDSEKAMVRIDMSEYMEKFSVQRLIGAPPGYVGYDEGGQLTEAVRRKPYSVILLDEIEKAHPDVFNVLLQVLDDGRLTDGQGRVVSFKNTIIIMTSNIGSDQIREISEKRKDAALDSKGKPKDLKASKSEDKSLADLMNNPEEMTTKNLADIANKMQDALKSTFKPEFLNRIDEIITFDELSLSDIEPIVDLQLNDVRKRLADRDITLEVDGEALEHLAIDGYDPVYGARPLKRLVQREIVDKIANEVVAGKLVDKCKVKVFINKNGDYDVKISK